MAKPVLNLFILTLFLASTQAHAVIIGDKDWLQVTETSYARWSELDYIFDTSTGQCDVADCALSRIGELAGVLPDIDLTGYIWADNEEVNNLFQSYLGGAGLASLDSNNDTDVGIGGLNTFFADFTATYADVPVSGQALLVIDGWTRSRSPMTCGASGDSISAWNYQIDRPHSMQDMVALDTCNPESYSEWLGAWLYKPAAIPEPPITALFTIGLLGLGVKTYRKKKLKPTGTINS